MPARMRPTLARAVSTLGRYDGKTVLTTLTCLLAMAFLAFAITST